MIRILTGALAGLFLCGSAHAQMNGSAPSPLGITSPLGIGPAAQVPRTGIPLGTTELGSIGISPATSGTSPVTPPTTNSMATCIGINSAAGNLSGGLNGVPSAANGSSGTAGSLFDGGGVAAGTASGTCAGIGAAASNPAASASSPTGMASTATGRIGVPMGSVELGVGGISPMPQIPTPNSMAPTLTPTPLLPGTGVTATSPGMPSMTPVMQ